MLQWIVESRLGDLSQALKEGTKLRDLRVGNGKNRWCLYIEGMRNGDGIRRRVDWCPHSTDQVLDGVRMSIDAHGTWICGRPSGNGKSTRRRKSSIPNRECCGTCRCRSNGIFASLPNQAMADHRRHHREC